MSQAVVLVSYPVAGEFRSQSVLDQKSRQILTRPPLGVLSVAALLRQQAVAVSVFDLDLFWFNSGLQDSESRLEAAASHLARACVDWYGFSTICSSYALTLRLIRALKRLKPEARVVLGGPQASNTAIRTMEAFPEVDYVLCGEVEESLAAFVEHGLSFPSRVPGLVFRTPSGIQQNPWPTPPPASKFATPAYDLWPQTLVPVLPVESGRGCPFGCRFCSTSPFFGRRFRTRSALDVVRECELLVAQYGSHEVSLINDHIAVDVQFLRDLTRAWTESSVLRNVPFSCSLRPDAATVEVIELLRQAGGHKVFLGIETGSQRMQRLVGKNIRVDKILPLLQEFHIRGIQVTAAFIVGFPEETLEDLSQTFLLIEQLLPWPNVSPVINILSPHAGSAYDTEWAGRLVFDPAFSAHVTHSLGMDSQAVQFVQTYPELCSSDYAYPLQHLDREFVVHAARFHRYITSRLRVLAMVGSKVAGSSLELFQAWQVELADQGILDWGEAFYAGGEFLVQFQEFLRRLSRSAAPGPWIPWLEDALAMQTAVDLAFDALAGGQTHEAISVDATTVLVPGPELAWSPFRPSELAQALREGRVPERPCEGTYLRVAPASMEGSNPEQRPDVAWEVVVREPNALVQAVLARANCGITVGTLLQSLTQNPAVDSLPNSPQTWLQVLQTLLEQRYLVPQR